MVTGFRGAMPESGKPGVGAPGRTTYLRAMAWLTLLLAALLQAAAPSGPASPAPRQPPPAPVRPRPWAESGPSIVYFALGSARVEGEGIAVVTRMADDHRGNGRVTVLANADHRGTRAANLRLSQRRARAVATALVSGIPRAVIVLRPVGEGEPQVMTPDGVPDPFNRYARIIFPVPPPAD